MSINGIANTFEPITLSGLTTTDSLSGTYIPYSNANQDTDFNNTTVSNIKNLYLGKYYVVSSIQVLTASTIFVNVTSIPYTTWTIGNTIRILKFTTNTVFNTTYTITSLNSLGFGATFTSGLSVATYTSPLAYAYLYNTPIYGQLDCIGINAINSISGNSLSIALAITGESLALTKGATGMKFIAGEYFNVPVVQVLNSTQVAISFYAPAYPTLFPVGTVVKIVGFTTQTILNTTYTVVSAGTWSGGIAFFYASFSGGLPVGFYYGDVTTYMYKFDDVTYGNLGGINLFCVNTVTGDYVWARNQALLNNMTATGVTSITGTGSISITSLTASGAVSGGTLSITSSGSIANLTATGNFNAVTSITTPTLTVGGLITSNGPIYGSSTSDIAYWMGCNGSASFYITDTPANLATPSTTFARYYGFSNEIFQDFGGTFIWRAHTTPNQSLLTRIMSLTKTTLAVLGKIETQTFQSNGNGWTTSSPSVILASCTDWIGSSFGNFASITDVSGNRQNGLGIGIDSTGNTWMISLKPSIAWKTFNQVASSYTYYTNTRGPTNPVLAIDAYGKTTILNGIVLKGDNSLASNANKAPNLLCYVSSDSFAYPVISTFSYDHGNCALMFDMMFTTNWTSCFNEVNWMIYKTANVMKFQYIPAVAAGTLSTPVTTLQLSSTDILIQSVPLKLKGPAYQSSTTGPNIQLYTDSDSYAYPTITSFNHVHDNVAFLFDIIYDAFQFKSCFNSINWAIYKVSGSLYFNYMPAVSAGTASALSTMMKITSTGVAISPTSGNYSAPNVLHLIKDVPSIGDTSLMITFENTTAGYYDFMCGYYREPSGGGTWSVRGGTTSYTTALPLFSVLYNGFCGVNGVQLPSYALDTGNSSVGCSSVTSTTSLTMTTAGVSPFYVSNGAVNSMSLNQATYNNISNQNGLTSIGVGFSWYFGTLFTQDSLPGITTRALSVGYSNPLDTGYIICLAPSVAWKNLAINANQINFYIQGTLAAYVNAGGVVNVSDEREKEDIIPLKTKRSLERVLACNTVSYKRKSDDPLISKEQKDKKYVGLLAQQAYESNPHCVSQWQNDEKEERLGIQYNDYVVHLIGSVQEQQRQLKEQDEKIKILEATVLAQNNKLELFEAHLIQLTNQLNNITLNK